MRRYSDGLLLKNVVIGLTFTVVDFPSTLADAGYSDIVLEETLSTPTHSFIFDCLVSAPERNRSLLLELKGGDYSPVESQQRFHVQLSKYTQLQARDVARIARIAPPQPPAEHQHDLTILTVPTTLQDLEVVLNASAFKPPVMVASLQADDPSQLPYFRGLSVAIGSLRDAELETACKLPCEPCRIPMLLPFDPDSPNGDIVAAMVPTLIELLIATHGSARFSTKDLLTRALTVWGLLSQDEQHRYETRVRKVLQAYLTESGFSSFLNWERHSGTWVFNVAISVSVRDWQDHLTKLATQVITHANKPSLHDVLEP